MKMADNNRTCTKSKEAEHLHVSSEGMSVKVGYLNLWVDDKGLDVFEGFTIAKPTDAVISNESFDSFTDLKILVKDCGYQEEKCMVGDTIVFCCKHPKVHEKCLDHVDTLTSEKAIKISRNYETNLSSLKKFTSHEDPTVNTLSQEKHLPWNHQQSSNKSKGKTEKTTEAKDVESKHKCRQSTQEMPSNGATVQTLQKMNYFLKLCLLKEVHQLQEVANSDQETERDSDQEESKDDLLFVRSVKSSYEIIVIEDTEVRFQLDRGAKANVMLLKTYNNLRRRPPLTKINTVLISFSKQRLKPRGEEVLSTK